MKPLQLEAGRLAASQQLLQSVLPRVDQTSKGKVFYAAHQCIIWASYGSDSSHILQMESLLYYTLIAELASASVRAFATAYAYEHQFAGISGLPWVLQESKAAQVEPPAAGAAG